MQLFKYTTSFLLLVAVTACSHSPELMKSPDEDQRSVSAELAKAPQWSKEAVWYQIFVDRFRNGDPNNDPTREDIDGAYPGVTPQSWKVTPWTQDWYKLNDYTAELEGHKDYYGNPIENFSQIAQLRRYGGDLQGVIDKIDYFVELGVTAIYFNPLNDAPTLHKFDARNWRHIDRNFGPDPEKDVATMAAETPDDPSTWQWTEADKMFLELVRLLKAKNIRVIMDYSWNHTGHTFWAFEDVRARGKDSKFADWFIVESFDDPATPEDEFKYQGWFGVVELPEILETVEHDNQKIVAVEGDIKSNAVKEHIFAVTRRWLDPNGDGDPSDGVDGFRLDVAAEVGLGFWREYRQVVRETNPEAYLVGEVWWETWPDKLTNPEPFLRGDVFDAVMNYRWYRTARHFFNGAPDHMPVTEFVDELNALLGQIRTTNNYAMMNLTSSHDAPRTLTSMYNKNKYKFHSNPSETNDYKIDKPDAETIENLKLLLAHQFTYVGAPHIWAGDEMGMWGSDDPSNRKPLIWPDYEFEPEVVHPLGKARPKNPVEFDKKLFEHYKALVAIRKDNPVLSSGDIKYLVTDDNTGALAYSRYDDDSEVIAVFNIGDKAQPLSLPVRSSANYSDVLNGIPVTQSSTDQIDVVIPSRTAAILKRN